MGTPVGFMFGFNVLEAKCVSHLLDGHTNLGHLPSFTTDFVVEVRIFSLFGWVFRGN